MLEQIREGSQGLIVKIILSLIIVTFALAGIGSYLTAPADANAVVVNGQEITRSTFEQAYQIQKQRMQSQFGEMFDQLANDTTYLSNIRKGVLDNLVNEALQTQLAESIGMRISTEQLKTTIREMPEFQVDGNFSNDRYLSAIRQAGYQPHTFRQYLRNELVRRQLIQSILNTDFALPKEVERYIVLEEQSRTLEYTTLLREQFIDEDAVTAEEIETYYQGNLGQFNTEEQISLEYIQLNKDDFFTKVIIDEADAEQYYQDNLQDYQSDERRRASHILIEIKEDDDAAARTKAEELLTQIQGGADFAELAKSNSDDTFSGEVGGDLDLFERGVMAPAFEETVFSMATVGEISEVVKTEFGFHIIKLTEIEPIETRPFEVEKANIINELTNEQVNELYIEQQEAAINLAFENPDSLMDIAGAIDIEAQTTDLFSRFSAPVPFNNPKVLTAAFSDMVLVEQINSELIEVSPSISLIIRLANHQPERVKTLDEVSAQIRTTVAQERAQELATAQAETLLSALQTGQSLADIAKENTLEVTRVDKATRRDNKLSFDLKTKAFAMSKPTAEQASYDFVTLANGDIALIHLTEVVDGIVGDDTGSTKQRIVANVSQNSYQSFLEALNASAEVNRQIDDYSAPVDPLF